jgi:hypothetical protein
MNLSNCTNEIIQSNSSLQKTLGQSCPCVNLRYKPQRSEASRGMPSAQDIVRRRISLSAVQMSAVNERSRVGYSVASNWPAGCREQPLRSRHVNIVNDGSWLATRRRQRPLTEQTPQ